MSSAAKILALAGSLRRESYNKRLVHIAAEGARTAGAEVTTIDLRDYALPIFDEDLESKEGLPENGRRLKELMLANQGLLIASPEYNSSITAVLKNTIDWVSRPEAGQEPLACFTGKAAAIMSASPGALGGLRGLVHLRSILGNIRVLVMPEQIAIPQAHEAFAPNGTLKDPRLHEAATSLGSALANLVTRLHHPP